MCFVVGVFLVGVVCCVFTCTLLCSQHHTTHHKKHPHLNALNHTQYPTFTQLADLQGTVLSLVLFGRAHEAFYREPEGMVVAVFDANPKRGGGGGASGFSVSVSQARQVLVVGRCPDFGTCKALRKVCVVCWCCLLVLYSGVVCWCWFRVVLFWVFLAYPLHTEQQCIQTHSTCCQNPTHAQDGQPCRMPVNISQCPYCEYHVASQYKAMQLKVAPQFADNNLMTAYRPAMHHNRNGSRGGMGDGMGDGGDGRPVARVRRMGSQEIRDVAQRCGSGSNGARYVGARGRGGVVCNVDVCAVVHVSLHQHNQQHTQHTQQHTQHTKHVYILPTSTRLLQSVAARLDAEEEEATIAIAPSCTSNQHKAGQRAKHGTAQHSAEELAARARAVEIMRQLGKKTLVGGRMDVCTCPLHTQFLCM